MRKAIIIALMLLVLLNAGCAGIGSSPTKTVENFVSQFDEGNYDECYDMMSSDYKQYTDFASFVNSCKDVNPEKYELIEISNEYIYEDEAVVDVLVNRSSVESSSWLETLLEGTSETGMTTEQIELVKQEDEWKITVFPYVLT
ncbi:hypothetical protein [Methanolobus sp. ZRKC5]|uniref:hypothetical protein n=1 Tax=unclassified Methanolobus TaxID=2629569 RepID=UPI00313BD8F5